MQTGLLHSHLAPDEAILLPVENVAPERTPHGVPQELAGDQHTNDTKATNTIGVDGLILFAIKGQTKLLHSVPTGGIAECIRAWVWGYVGGFGGMFHAG